MLQSRPITNLDNSFTDFEIMHEIDTGHPTEVEIYSRAHWGENFPGSSSYLLFTYSMKGADVGMIVSDLYNYIIIIIQGLPLKSSAQKSLILKYKL